MCSIIRQSHGSGAARLAALVGHSAEVIAEIAELAADPDVLAELASLQGDSLAEHVVTLLGSADRATASATVLTGQVEASGGRAAGKLIAGTYASTTRFLEVEAGVSATTARAIVGRARDLREDYSCLAAPWLAGAVSGDAVREVACGIRTAIRHSGLPAAEREVARKAALDIVLPVAERGTVGDVKRVLARLRLATDPDGAAQAAMDAYVDQSLTVEQVGAMARLTAWLTLENAAAVMTVLTQRVDRRRRDGDLSPEELLPEGVDPETWDGRRQANERHSHLLAVAFGEAFTDLLDDNDVGSHHGIAPHVTLTVDVARFEAGLGGELAVPGSDIPVVVPSATVERILCDCDATTVVVRQTPTVGSDARGSSVADLLLDEGREVLYVGRTERVVPPRLRRALEVRDGHCRFPGCRGHVRRCHAHHVREWEAGDPTDLDNLLLLCVRHHHAVHEGGWSIRRAADVAPGATGCWVFTPPARRLRP
jgi:hypothetical protein